jgi:hypothetical protein
MQRSWCLTGDFLNGGAPRHDNRDTVGKVVPKVEALACYLDLTACVGGRLRFGSVCLMPGL